MFGDKVQYMRVTGVLSHCAIYHGAKIKRKCEGLSLEICGNLIRKRKSGMGQSPQINLIKCSKTQMNILGTKRSEIETRTMRCILSVYSHPYCIPMYIL